MNISIKKGLDLPIEGAVAEGTAPVKVSPGSVAVCPDDYPGFIAKVDVKEGDAVVAGSPLMHHKEDERLKLVSPATGTVRAVVRGERRKIERVVIDVRTPASAEKSTGSVAPKFNNTDDIARALAENGLLALVRRRPYAIVASPAERPRDIFVTGFDSSPLSVLRSYDATEADTMSAGVALLSGLTAGRVYITRRSAAQLPDVSGAEMVTVSGPHPAGLAGTVISRIRPINKGEVVWTLDAPTLLRIGRFAQTGHTSWTTEIAVTGSEIDRPYIAETLVGALMKSLVEGKLKNAGHNVRFISGNVLTGIKTSADGYLHYPYTQVTVIPEGDDVDEFMGWASFSPKKMSVNPSFPGYWLHRLFNPDARTLGGRRAMIQSGEYERVMPLDILPEYLLKALKSQNIDDMEKLGIYEVAPEDFALAEYVDSSKQPLQAIVRNGLDYLRKETE